MYVTEGELDHLMEKMQKMFRFSCQKGQIRILYNYSGSASDLAKKFRIRNHSGDFLAPSPLSGIVKFSVLQAQIAAILQTPPPSLFFASFCHTTAGLVW